MSLDQLKRSSEVDEAVKRIQRRSAELVANPTSGRYGTYSRPKLSLNNPSIPLFKGLRGGNLFKIGNECYRFYDYGPGYTTITVTDGNSLSSVVNKGVEIIDASEYTQMLTKKNESKKKIFQYDREKEESKDYMTMDYSLPQKELICSNDHFKTGVYNKDTFIIYQEEFCNRAFERIKVSNETTLFIAPYDWCIINGYNESFVRQYLDIINSFGIGKFEILSLDKDDSFGNYQQFAINNGIANNLFYTIKISCDNDNYLSLLQLVTTIYSGNFAGLFMQFRKLDLALTDWQTWMIAEIFLNRYEGITRPNEFQLYSKNVMILPHVFSEHNSCENLSKLSTDTGLDFYDNMVSLVVPKIAITDIATYSKKREYKEAFKTYIKLLK